MSLSSGSSDWGRYPFLSDASYYIKQNKIDFAEFNRPEMRHIIDRAVERIETEIGGKVYENLTEYDEEVLTFIIMLMIVKHIGQESLLKKIALFEAIRAERFLIEDLSKQFSSKESKDFLLFTIFKELLNLDVDIIIRYTKPSKNSSFRTKKELFRIKIPDYLIRATHFHEQEWKLVNQLVHEGYVYLDADEIVRLIRSELTALIRKRVRTMQLPTIPESIMSKAEELRIKFLPKQDYHSYTITAYPPCIIHAIETMNKGENLPHSARVMLATYMLRIGKPIDEIVVMFHNAPDFNEKITRYQVEHLAGIKGSRTKYSVPSCEKLRGENLCYATKECNGIINPIQFGRRFRSDDKNE